VRRLAEAGHEPGCHGWSHDPVYQMPPERFRGETRRAVDVISAITGMPVIAYRAPFFSIPKASLWALEVLASLGFRYDSSVFPVAYWRNGIPDLEPHPQRIVTPSGPIMKFPLPVRRAPGCNWTVSGGAHFRIYPYVLTKANFRAIEAEGKPLVFCIHPWELDPGHPRVQFCLKARLTHHANLASTEPKLRRLMNDSAFGPLGKVLEHEFAKPTCAAGARRPLMTRCCASAWWSTTRTRLPSWGASTGGPGRACC
jgi:polysaccharide deacetylase family protein (PEP-CTERM system associated)